jgi:U3 small nucleolar RNA-associated protein 18
LCFSRDESKLYTAGDEAEIYEWDLRSTRKCLTRFSDEGAFSTTALAVSNNSLATGSKMGSVNIYSLDTLGQEKPVKTLMNLTTQVTQLDFNHTGELLSFSSKWKKNAVKMAHLPSYTVYQNYPGVAPGVLKYAFCGGFSYSSRYFGLGTDEGKCHMFELEHFAAKK